MSVSRVDSAGAVAATSERVLPILTSDPTALLAMTLAEQCGELEDMERATRRASQECQYESQRHQISAMHQAADQAMYAGIVGGITTIASGASQMIGAASEGGSPGAQSNDNAAVGQSSVSGGDLLEGGTSAVTGGLEILGSWFQRESARASAEAARHEADASRHGAAAAEEGEDAASAARSQDRMLQHASAVVEARRQAEQAATRA